MYHGKVKGVIIPTNGTTKLKASKHPLFGMASADKEMVEKVMDKLRGGRYKVLKQAKTTYEDTGKRLAQLAGTEKGLKPIPRRRSK